jgi:hypothetical protein
MQDAAYELSSEKVGRFLRRWRRVGLWAGSLISARRRYSSSSLRRARGGFGRGSLEVEALCARPRGRYTKSPAPASMVSARSSRASEGQPAGHGHQGTLRLTPTSLSLLTPLRRREEGLGPFLRSPARGQTVCLYAVSVDSSPYTASKPRSHPPPAPA